MATDVITTRTSKIWLREDGLVQVVMLPNAEETLADAQAAVAAGFKAGGEHRRPLLVDLRAVKSINREARVYYSSAEVAQMITALGLLVGSPTSRMLANFFIGLNKSPVPTRLVTSEAEAIAWLTNFIEPSVTPQA